MKKKKKIYLQQKKRSLQACFGSQKKPRLSVFRSHQHIYAQLIDDEHSHTLAFSSTRKKEISQSLASTANQEAAFQVGKALALQAQTKNITTVVFDRGFRPYHGRIQKVAEGARQGGLLF